MSARRASGRLDMQPAPSILAKASSSGISRKKIPDQSKTLVLYCGGGFRSALAADNLQKMGYTDVISLDGGWRAYTTAGLPVEK